LSDNRTKPIWEDGSETALYRGSGRLFKPRPGPTSLSRVKNSRPRKLAHLRDRSRAEHRLERVPPGASDVEQEETADDADVLIEVDRVRKPGGWPPDALTQLFAKTVAFEMTMDRLAFPRNPRT
jgi:hypothetical protein